MKKTILLILSTLLLESTQLVFAQEQSFSMRDVEWGISGGVGKTFKHNTKMNFPFPDYTYSAEITALYQTSGARDWHKKSKFPKIGFIGHFVDFNSEILGKGFGIGPAIELPIVSGNKLTLSGVLSMGAGWMNRPHRRDNEENLAIGSHINNFTSANLRLKYALDEERKHQILAQLKFFHTSNAAFTVPNLGLNDLSLQLGYAFRFSEYVERPVSSLTYDWEKEKWWKNINYRMAYGMGRGQQYPSFGPRYNIHQLQLGFAMPYSSFKEVALLYEYEYHEGVYSFLKGIEYEGDLRQLSSQHSVLLGHEFKFGPVGIITQLGFYFTDHYLNSKRIYQKIGGHIYLWEPEKDYFKKLYLTAILKTHLSVADYVTFGIGLEF